MNVTDSVVYYTWSQLIPRGQYTTSIIRCTVLILLRSWSYWDLEDKEQEGIDEDLFKIRYSCSALSIITSKDKIVSKCKQQEPDV